MRIPDVPPELLLRWKPGRPPEYRLPAVCASESCYSLYKESEGARGQRPPSYTDRVLFSSFPDLRDHKDGNQLICDDYDLCEAVHGSDHRPVASSLRLFVAEDWAAWRKEDGLMTWKVDLWDIAFVPHSGRGRRSAGLTSLVVHFPLSTEDPLAAEGLRRACLLEAQGLGAGGGENGGGEANPWATVHRLGLEARGVGGAYRGGTFSVLIARQQGGSHAALTVRGEGGARLGQAMLCLEREIRGRWLWRFSGPVTLEVTDGGELVGQVSLRVRVSSTEVSTESALHRRGSGEDGGPGGRVGARKRSVPDEEPELKEEAGEYPC